MVKVEIHLQEKTLFDLGVAQYSLHHDSFVIFSLAKSEVGISNGLRGDAFTKKYIIWPLTFTLGTGSHKSYLLPSSSCNLFTC